MKNFNNSVLCIVLILAGFISSAFGGDDKISGKTNGNKSSDNCVLNYNNFSFPIDNKGIIADVNDRGVRFNEKMVIFSGGFYLSGYAGKDCWSNGQFSSARINDYVPGPVGSSVYDSKNSVYLVTKYDSPFGLSWQEWKDAVSIGANFYDGDKNGVYNPVDKNGNGVWDADEDAPDLIGDFTAWCVYNDGLAPVLRTFNNVQPQGIEIRQTVFGFSSKADVGNAVFVRYSIVNTGAVADVMDSVYFSAAVDPDLGAYFDDWIGCDSTINCGYVFGLGNDPVFGPNPPCCAVSYLQGPQSFIPGVTYTDVDKNGKFDKGIDIPLKSAVDIKGKLLGADTVQGAMNLPMTSFTQIAHRHATYGDPNTLSELRNFLLGGLNRYGNRLEPCSWEYGNGSTIADCKQVNPKYMYSGNPVTGTGWLNTVPMDQCFLASSGPFQLEKGKPADIVVAYIIGAGDTPLNSITKALAGAQNFKRYFDSNFSTYTGVKNGAATVNSFELFQNYPNPFNPATKIKYNLPAEQKITLKVFNTLGQMVKCLVDEVQNGGEHEAVFNASDLSSGIYFYELKTETGSAARKLLLLK